MNTPVASLPAKLKDWRERLLKHTHYNGHRCEFRADCEAVAESMKAALASPAIPPGYDRELIARMLFDYSNISGGRYEAQSARKQAQLISEADNATGGAVTVNRSPAGEGGLPPERVEDDKDWAFIERCKNECGASYDDGDDGIFWTFDLAAMKKLRRLATTEQPGSAVQGEAVAYRLWNGNGWDYSQRPFSGYAAQPLYTTPPPAPAAGQSDLP